MERRISVRVDTNVGIACRMPATPQQAILRDLSLDGCCIEIESRLSGLGTTVVLDLNKWISIPGTIVWRKGTSAGVRFERRLDLARIGLLEWIESAERGLAAKLAERSEAA